MIRVTSICLLLIAALPGSVSASIQILSTNVKSDARYGKGDIDVDLFTGTVIPTSTTLVASAEETLAKTTIDLTALDALSTLFSFGFDHLRSGDVDATYSRSQATNFTFTSTSDLEYTLSGAYSAGGGEGRVRFTAKLENITTKSVLFENRQDIFTTPHVAFALGNTNGVNDNYLEGSLFGTLLANNQYRLTFEAFSQIRDAIHQVPGPTATGSGQIALLLTENPTSDPTDPGDPPVVPEPSSWLIFVTLVGIVAVARRRRTA